MKILFVVNRVAEIVPSQTTAMLMETAARRDHDVYVCGVADLEVESDAGITAHAFGLGRELGFSSARLWSSLRHHETKRLAVESCDVLFLRTSPSRDTGRAWAHRAALGAARLARGQGVLVINDPDALSRVSDKLSLFLLPPALRPRTLVSHDPRTLREFISRLRGPCVLKPLAGSRGRDVFVVQQGDSANLAAMIDVLVRDGFAVAQEFLPEATAGDVRLVLWRGAPLVADGHVAAIRRIPAAGEMRSNIHAGGKASAVELSDGLRAVADAVGPVLRDEGILLAGIDVVGDKVLEINVFSTGGLHAAEELTGAPFAETLLGAVEDLRGRP